MKEGVFDVERICQGLFETVRTAIPNEYFYCPVKSGIGIDEILMHYKCEVAK